jgi:predicted transcriptional regulator
MILLTYDKAFYQQVILQINNPGLQTISLAYESQLNWPRFAYYRDFLINRKLLIPSDKEQTQLYETTSKGQRFLGLFADMEADLRPVNSMEE